MDVIIKSYPILYTYPSSYDGKEPIGTLLDVLTCRVEAEINGVYSLTMRYKYDGVHSSEITENTIIGAYASAYKKDWFRPYSLTVKDNVLTVKAHHVSYDLGKIIVNRDASEQSGAALLDKITYNDPEWNSSFLTGYHGFWIYDGENGQVVAGKTASVPYPISVRNLLMGGPDSLVEKWGVELDFYEFDIALMNQIGSNKGLEIRHAFNMGSFSHELNASERADWLMGYYLVDNESSPEYLTAMVPVNGNSTTPKNSVKVIDVTAEFQATPRPSDISDYLTQYITAHPELLAPQVSIDVSVIDLANSVTHSDLVEQDLELGDTVKVIHPNYGVAVEARCRRIEFDSLLRRNNRVIISSVPASIEKTIAKQQIALERWIKKWRSNNQTSNS